MKLAAIWRRPDDMASRIGEWRELAENAVEANVFAEADYVVPALRNLGDGGARFLTVERDGRLVGLLLLRIERWRWALPLPVAVHHIPYAPHGTPLIDASCAEAVCASFLDELSTGSSRAFAVLLPLLDESGPFAMAWRAAVEKSGRARAVFDRFERPALLPDPIPTRQDYLETRLSKERRRRAQSTRRRVERDLGPMTTIVSTTPAEVAEALDAFMEVELSGWKGRRGTAVGARPRTAAFFRESLDRLAHRNQIILVTLALQDASFASAVLARARDRVWFYKTAYAERYARYSPGVALDLAVTEILLSIPEVTLGDSLAVVPDPGFERIWRERLPMADWLTLTAPNSSGASLGATLEQARRGVRARAKGVVTAFRSHLER